MARKGKSTEEIIGLDAAHLNRIAEEVARNQADKVDVWCGSERTDLICEVRNSSLGGATFLGRLLQVCNDFDEQCRNENAAEMAFKPERLLFREALDGRLVVKDRGPMRHGGQSRVFKAR